jgi:hypothetical protein
VTNLRLVTLSISFVFVACAAQASGPSGVPKPSRAALAAKPVEWAKRSPGTLLVPSSTKHLQLVVTPGWTKQEHFAWLIAEGTEVVTVYRSTNKDLGEILGEVLQRYFPSSSFQDTRSFVILGSIKGPPPPPPDPGGFPVPYVESVLAAAFRLNREALQQEAVAGP